MTRTANQDPETRDRVCLACGHHYVYPVPHSHSTRFHCENCAELPPNARKALERLNSRIRAMEKSLAKAREAESQ